MKREITDLIEGKYPEFLENLEIPFEITRGGACMGADPELFFIHLIIVKSLFF